MTDNQARPEIRVPRRNGAGASLAELTLLVRVPSNPDLTAVYTDEQAEEARQYAAANGGTVVALPVDDGPWDWERSVWRSSPPITVVPHEHNTRSEHGSR
ncbi:hypothetical protein ONA92_26720 [Mycobacteroides salmoniphilum]|uniref:hypothetical protein n=1 Tax=Mycobacteroides salmoniphilum TaxID=404941 RepID=UPI0035618B15